MRENRVNSSSESRREFLKRTALAVGGATLGMSLPSLRFAGGQALAESEEEKKTEVVVVTSSEVIDKDKPLNTEALRRMMEKGITELAGKSDVAKAWQTFIKASDNVVLADAGTWLANPPEVVVEVMRGIKLASPKKMTLAHYSGLPKSWVDAVRGGLKEAEIPQEVMDNQIYRIPARFPTMPFTSLVMTPTLKSHRIAGVSGVVKHYATMCKEGPAPHHPNGMETAGSVIVPQFGYMSHLIIVDALRFGEETRGPQFFQKSLIFGTDPVAADVVALDIYLKNCKTSREIPPERHRQLADTRYHAGISDMSRIEVRRFEM
ncbi:TPA: DUF362 domain-containing protein [Candidatus Poribacteria bacterium]|nr:DUF362 domain-containing protein [Candidatus Poribacteria bacterium]